jgi:tetratricopeptide (TPR) repeat protein
MACRDLSFLVLNLVLVVSFPAFSQQGGVGSIVGELQQTRGDLAGRMLVELQLRGAPIASTYSDDEGKFGFYGLGSNPYHVLIRDEHFRPIDELVALDTAISPISLVRISLTPLEAIKKDPLPKREEGGNRFLIDPTAYQRHFPKRAVKEFDKGVAADKDGRLDDAIHHYQKAVAIAPDFYPAHNNLGSNYLSRSDFSEARLQFEEVVRLNQSDAAGYLNLSNVSMLTGKLDEAQEFLSEGMRRQPDSALGTFLRGSLDIRLGKLMEAEQNLRRAIELSPTMSQARLQLVNLLMREGRKDDAVAQLHNFVDAFPENSFSPQAKQLLQKLEAQNKNAN